MKVNYRKFAIEGCGWSGFAMVFAGLSMVGWDVALVVCGLMLLALALGALFFGSRNDGGGRR